MTNDCKLPVLIFDFDGTIADTFAPTMEILRADYLRWGDRFHKRHTINQLRSLSIREIVKTIPGGWWKFIYLLLKAKHYIKTHPEDIKPYPGIVYTLRTLRDEGYLLFIVTSNQVTSVKRFLRQFDLDDIFAAVISTNGLWRKAKTLRQLLHSHHLSPADCLYIGDEIRDIQACQKVDLPIVSVTYGFNSQVGLAKYHPNHMVKKPTQLLTLLADMQRKNQCS